MLDPIRLQSLVDGECNASERRALIDLCEANPECWRKVALAYIEEQVFAKDFSRFPQRSVGNQPAPQDGPELSRVVQVQFSNETEFPVALQSTAAPQSSVTNEDSPRSGRSSFVAASLAGALLFAGGMTTNRWLERSEEQRLPAGGTAMIESHSPSMVGTSDTSAHQSDITKPLPEITLPNANALVRAGKNSIPLYESDEVSPAVILAKQEQELTRLRDHWMANGYSVEVEPSYLSGALPDGRTWVIPVRDLNVTPMGQ